MVLYIHVIHKLLWYIRDWDQINTKHYCAENAVACCVIFNQKCIFLLEKKSSLKKKPFLPFVSEGHNNWLGFCFLLTRHSLNVLFSPRLLVRLHHCWTWLKIITASWVGSFFFPIIHLHCPERPPSDSDFLAFSHIMNRLFMETCYLRF